MSNEYLNYCCIRQSMSDEDDGEIGVNVYDEDELIEDEEAAVALLGLYFRASDISPSMGCCIELKHRNL